MERSGAYRAFIRMKLLPSLLLVAIAFAAGGCANASIEPAGYASASCIELNEAIGVNSRQVSALAIERGKVDRWDAPRWLPGAARGTAAVSSRQTSKIEQLQQSGDTMKAERASRCFRTAR